MDFDLWVPGVSRVRRLHVALLMEDYGHCRELAVIVLGEAVSRVRRLRVGLLLTLLSFHHVALHGQRQKNCCEVAM